MTRAEALAQVYRQEWQRMVGIVSRALPRGEAEDVVAQAFADVWAVSTLTDVERLRRYLWKAVWNGCADMHRRGRHTREVELDLRTQTLGAREFRAADARLDLWRGPTERRGTLRLASVPLFRRDDTVNLLVLDWRKRLRTLEEMNDE